MATVSNTLSKLLYILQDENNPYGSNIDSVWPETVFDQVYDNLSATHKTLREVIADIRQEIITGGTGDIVFPVTTVQGRRGDVVLVKEDIGLGNVDNTADMAKPLSDSQRTSVQIMIDNAVAQVEHPRLPDGTLVDFQELVDHMLSTSNPHNVTFNQINARGDVTTHISSLISAHNNSQSAHQDIRERINDLSDAIDSIGTNVDEKIDNIGNTIERHYADPAAHATIFDTKENISNKVNNFNLVNHVKYPTVRAVVEYVAAVLADFQEEYANVETWINDIYVVNTRDDIPEASFNNFQDAYFIRRAPNNTTEIAICRKINDSEYYWDYTTFTSHAEFDDRYFYESEYGLTINTQSIAELILDDENILQHITDTVDTVVHQMMAGYVTNETFYSMANVTKINMLSGTVDGSIRFYINNDPSTMSNDISITGLKRCAYLDRVSSDTIEHDSIGEDHIQGNAINTTHIQNQAVTLDKMSAGYMTVIGNVTDPSTRRAEEITIEQLAILIKDIIDNM